MEGKSTKKLEEFIKPTYCAKCGAAYTYKSLGVYECPECGFIEKDEYAKVREYIEENGATSAVVLSNATGIPIGKINQLLREGRIEIPNESPVFIKCETCNTDIRFGRYCPACAAKMSSQLQGVYSGAVGEVPTRSPEKMRFLDKKLTDDKKRR